MAWSWTRPPRRAKSEQLFHLCLLSPHDLEGWLKGKHEFEIDGGRGVGNEGMKGTGVPVNPLNPLLT